MLYHIIISLKNDKNRVVHVAFNQIINFTFLTVAFFIDQKMSTLFQNSKISCHSTTHIILYDSYNMGHMMKSANGTIFCHMKCHF